MKQRTMIQGLQTVGSHNGAYRKCIVCDVPVHQIA